MWASQYNQRETVLLLLQRGATTQGASTEAGATALILAASKGYSGVVELLLKAGAQPNCTCKVRADRWAPQKLLLYNRDHAYV